MGTGVSAMKASRLRVWRQAYLVAPIGTIAWLFLWGTYTASSGPFVDRSAATNIAIATAVCGVLISYVCGVLLLPVYVLFEACSWRGWKIYVPTGAAAGLLALALAGRFLPGLLTGWGGTEPVHPSQVVLWGGCGALSAAVFSIRIAREQSDGMTSLTLDQ
jgi:hypothetical protein